MPLGKRFHGDLSVTSEKRADARHAYAVLGCS
jgi:hypothetical protein